MSARGMGSSQIRRTTRQKILLCAAPSPATITVVGQTVLIVDDRDEAAGFTVVG